MGCRNGVGWGLGDDDGPDGRGAARMKRRLKPPIVPGRRDVVKPAVLATTRRELPLPFRAALAEIEHERRRLRTELTIRSRELLRTRAELRALADAFPDLLLRLDREWTILECRVG